MRRTFSGQQ